MKFLIACLDEIKLKEVGSSLKKLGHEFISITDEQQTIELFKQYNPDYLIVGTTLHEIDPKTYINRIQALGTEKKIPILFFSDTDDVIDLFTKDKLTGVNNRIAFDAALNNKLNYADKHNHMLGLLILDLDNIKTINFSFSHEVGDLLLKKISEKLSACLQPEDYIARLDGDEFGIIITNGKNSQAIGSMAEKLMNSLSTAFHIKGNKIYITASIGIVCFPFAEITKNTVLQGAYIAIEHAKKSGRNNYQYFTKELHEKHKEQLELESSLKFALEKNQLSLTYQPIFNLATQKMIGMEALLIWKHPKLGTISPNIFIALAEENGLITRIGNWVLHAVCKQRAVWYQAGYKEFSLAVNISTRQLLHKDLPQLVLEVLKENNVPPALIELELTETTVMTYSGLSERILKEIHDIGVHFSIDDFGAGYSSLAHLKHLPINAIKIDQWFVKNLTTDPSNRAIIRSLINLGKDLGLNVIAEGIETKEQLDFLIDNHCPQGQGFYLSEPLSVNDATLFLKKQT